MRRARRKAVKKPFTRNPRPYVEVFVPPAVLNGEVVYPAFSKRINIKAHSKEFMELMDIVRKQGV